MLALNFTQTGFLTAGFRPFFLLAALLGAGAMLVWLFLLNGYVGFSQVQDPIWWHAHEMTFAMSGAVLAGFLLTAVPGWSGLPRVQGVKLAILVALWLLARLALLFLGELHPLSYGLDTLWWLGITYVLAKPLISKKLWDNLFFVPVLIGLTLLNGLSYFHPNGIELAIASRVNSSAALIIILVMLTMGGRMFPIYTARSLNLKPIAANAKLDRIIAMVSILLVLGWLFVNKTQVTVWPLGALAIISGLLHLIRWSNWHPRKSIAISLLWSLHGAYLFIALGLIGTGLALVAVPQYLMLTFHLMTVGGMGAIILSMLTRVTLGHCRQPLVAPQIMTMAFCPMLLAVVLRSLLPMLFPLWSLELYSVSALCWIGAFSLYLWRFIPLLIKA